MGLSDDGVVLTVVSTGAGATASKAGCVDEDEDDASADLLEENGQTIMCSGRCGDSEAVIERGRSGTR